MSGLDIAILITAGLAMLIGFWRGLLRPVLGIAGFLLGLALAGAWHGALADALWPGRGTWASIASYAIILVVVLIITGIITGLVSRAVHMTPLGVIDRILGLVVAGLLVIAAWILVLSVASAVVPATSVAISQSPLAQSLVNSVSL